MGIVVQKEEPNLEKQKSELVIRVAAGKRQLVELEDQILKLLSESTGSLLVYYKGTFFLCVYDSNELYYEI